MQGATRRATIFVAIGGMALMLAAIDDYGSADPGVAKKGDRLRHEITVACVQTVVSDTNSTCETLLNSKARTKPGVTYVTTSFQDGDNATTLVKIRLEK